MLHLVLLVVFPLIVVFAAMSDFMAMTIPNRLTLALVAAFFVLAPFAGLGWHGFAMALLSGSVVFATGYVCFAFNWVGGGDVKFASAVALWLGWSHLFDYLVLFSLYGGILTIVVLTVSRFIEPLPLLQVGFLSRFSEHRKIPYGIALSVAALQLYPTTAWVLGT